MDTTEQLPQTEPSSTQRVPLEQAVRVKSITADHLFCRAFCAPAGIRLYTKQFADSHLIVLAKGSVLMDTGTEKLRFLAPAHYVLPPMVRAQVTTLEESIWYCMHVTDETDLEKLEEKF